MQTKLRYAQNKNKHLPTSSKKVNIQACANFVPSLVIGWQIIKSYQPITALGTKFAHG